MLVTAYDYLVQSQYFAPRGKKRLLNLGVHLSQRYLCPDDKLIGLVGKAGSGKSLLIRGMFPGIELTNDDDGINVRPLPLLHDASEGFFKHHSYHVDARFETAFSQIWEVAQAVEKAIFAGRRVIIEHFDMIYPLLKVNAEMLIGIGEEVIVTRPSVFGPEPDAIANIVFKSLEYRLMSHTAEHLVIKALNEIGMPRPEVNSDVKHGFVLEFSHLPNIDLDFLENRVLELIDEDLSVCYHDESHIKIGDVVWQCAGPRLHVHSTGKITKFHLMKEFKWDPLHQLHMIVGAVV